MTYTYIPEFIPAHTAMTLFNLFWHGLRWEERGKARKELWMNDFNRSYTYGKPPYERTYDSVPWHPNIEGLRDEVRIRLGCHFEGCFVNGYEGERNTLDWHADNDPGIDHRKPIAVLSLGQERPIQVRHEGTQEVTEFMLGSGSLFLMPAGSQSTHKHKIPKVGRMIGPRISLTFRALLPKKTDTEAHCEVEDLTHARCNQCGWEGLRGELKNRPERPIDEFCPSCGSHDTEWITKEELDHE